MSVQRVRRCSAWGAKTALVFNGHAERSRALQDILVERRVPSPGAAKHLIETATKGDEGFFAPRAAEGWHIIGADGGARSEE
jgi:hypothetical protein